MAPLSIHVRSGARAGLGKEEEVHRLAEEQFQRQAAEANELRSSFLARQRNSFETKQVATFFLYSFYLKISKYILLYFLARQCSENRKVASECNLSIVTDYYFTSSLLPILPLRLQKPPVHCCALFLTYYLSCYLLPSGCL